MVTATGRSSFGTLLREYRVAAGLSQEALAERATMSADGIGALERGVNRAPQRETLALIVEALRLDPAQRHAIEAAAVRPSRPRTSDRRKANKHNLPRPLSPLFGRENELVQLLELVAGSPVVTLIGAGGVGKTRLAIELGYAALEQCADGAWFADLAPLRDPGDVAPAIAELFEVRERADSALLEGIVGALGRRNIVLIIDNCEHVAPAAAAAVEAISAGCPRVRIVATSRQPLQIPGEQTYRVASLSEPAALALFADSARRADVSFVLAEGDVAIVQRICTRLDGIALAIELAAARVKLLTLVQIEELLSERFRMLTGGGRPARHQTMRALIDWSYELLSEEEQTLFARLAVFPAEFSLAAALAVCSGGSIAESRMLDLLGSLIDKSLLTVEKRGKTRWFRLLETMSEYAKEKLGDDIVPLTQRHAEFYLEMLEALDNLSTTWSASLEHEYENLRRALEWSIDDGGDVALGVRLLAAMREFFLLRGFAAEAARRVERVFANRTPLSTALQAMAWETLAAMRGDLLLPSRALEAAEHALRLYEELDDQPGIARLLRSVGVAHLRLGKFAEAEEDLKHSLELSRAYGDRRDVARSLGSMALAYEMTGRLEEGRAATLEVLEMARHDGYEQIVWVSLTNLAEAEFALGEVESAVCHLQELLANEMARKNVRIRANAEANLAAYFLALEREAPARATARAAVADAREAGDLGIMGCALGHLAAILSRSDPRNAARLLGYVESVFAEGYTREHTERFTHDLLMARLHAALSEAEIETLGREGAAMSQERMARLANRIAKDELHHSHPLAPARPSVTPAL